MVSQNNEPTMQTASIRQNYTWRLLVYMYMTQWLQNQKRGSQYFFSPNLSTTGRECVVSSWRVLDVFELHFN